MPHTLEEIASRELDTLFQCAVFLHAGDRRAAEGLLLRTLSRSFPLFGARDRSLSASDWLETRVVREFMMGFGEESVDPVPHFRDGSDVPTHGSIFERASTLPVAARGVLWLVLFRRWSYAQTRRVLELDEAAFDALLSYRPLLSAGGRRAEGGASPEWGVRG